MPDEQQATATTPEATGQPAVKTEQGAAALTETHPGVQWLNTASPEEIRKNERFMGILGERLAAEREQIRAQIQAENEAAARKKAEEDLLKLAQDDPFAFRDRYLTEAEQKRIKQETENLRQSTRMELFQMLGRSYAELPEWKELSGAEKEKIGAALMGKKDDVILAALNVAAVDIIAERRASKRHQAWREKDLAEERKAIKQEEAAQRLKSSSRPTLERASAPGEVDITQLPDKEFNKIYEERFLRGR